MPELPEVETTRRGISPHIRGREVTAITVRERRLRWPIPRALSRELPGQTVLEVGRRSKYLLIDTCAGDSARVTKVAPQPQVTLHSV